MIRQQQQLSHEDRLEETQGDGGGRTAATDGNRDPFSFFLTCEVPGECLCCTHCCIPIDDNDEEEGGGGEGSEVSSSFVHMVCYENIENIP